MSTMSRRALGALVTIVLVVGGGVTAAAQPAPSIPTLTDIRVGQHPGYDRIVLDFDGGPAPTVTNKWTDELLSDGSGEVFWLTGEHFVSVVSTLAAAHDGAGNSTYTGAERFRTRGLRNVMAVGLTGDFEGYVSVGLGTRTQTWVRT